jgi:hypothetical protein
VGLSFAETAFPANLEEHSRRSTDDGRHHADGATTWQSGGGRRIVLAFAFLLLLPFYASLGPMLFQRASRGLIGDTLSLAVLALAFTALMALILQQLIHAVRTRVTVSADGVKATVPAVGARGPFFMWNYITRDIPFSDVAGIDTRNEIYGRKLAPVLLTSTRIVTKTGEPLVLGYANANDAQPQFPFTEIGAEIAKRAGVAVSDHGTVHRSWRQRVGLTTSTNDAARLAPEEIAAINAAHTRNIRVMIGALALLVVGGITLDVATASRTSFAEMGAGLAKPEPKKK